MDNFHHDLLIPRNPASEMRMAFLSGDSSEPIAEGEEEEEEEEGEDIIHND